MSFVLETGKYVSSGEGLRTYIGELKSTADFDRPTLMPRGGDRKVAAYEELRRANRETMDTVAPQLDELRRLGLVSNYTVYPATNTVVIDVPDDKAADAWKAINKVDGMGRLVRNREVHLAPVEDAEKSANLVGEAGLEWNVAKVGADAVWASGYNGQGVVIGTIDTGVDFNHSELKGKYRGTGADGAVSHDYNWFDAFGKSKTPYDGNGHGTHVTGTEVSDKYGIAPGAKWIASKILSDSGSGSLESVTRGLEWMLAPTDSTGKNADPTKAPDVVNNSWGTNNGAMQNFRNIWKAFNAAGIIPVAAAGNSGPRAGSVGAPGSYPEGISVAATDANDAAANFSSRGPSPIKDDKGSDRKPDVAAPGVAVTSTWTGGGTKTISGTSMASPATTAVVALLLSKHKDLTLEEVRQALTTSAKDLGTEGYDYTYGYGRVDAGKALAAADAIVAARKPAA